MKNLTTVERQELANKIGADSIGWSSKGKCYVVFYRHGMSAEAFADRIKVAIPVPVAIVDTASGTPGRRILGFSSLSKPLMGTVRTPKYVMTMETPGYYSSPMGWDVRGRYGLPGNGQPTDANLAKHMEAFIASMKPGAPNAHLNDNPAKPYKPVRAAIYLNDGLFSNPLATWSHHA